MKQTTTAMEFSEDTLLHTAAFMLSRDFFILITSW
jgi:hypothetical protein